MARIVRSQVLGMRDQEFISAAILLGVPTRKVLIRHLIPNAALPSPYTNPYQFFYPVLIMNITILALNLFSGGLRDSPDPRLRK